MSLRADVTANYLGQGWAAVMGLAFIPVYIGYLGMESYGLIGFFALIQAWMTVLDFGLTPVVGREAARFKAGASGAGDVRQLLSRVTWLVAAGTVAMVLLGTLGAQWLTHHWLKADSIAPEAVTQSIVLMVVIACVRCQEGALRSAAAGLDRQVAVNVIGAAMATVRAVGAIAVLKWLSATIVAFFLWQLMMSLAMVALYGYLVLRDTRDGGAAVTPADPGPGAFGFARGVVAITVTSLLLTQLDKLVLSRLLTLEEFGHYSLAATVAGALMLVVTPLTQAFFPRFAATLAKGDTAALARAYHVAAQLVTVLLSPFALALFFFSTEVLGTWTGNAGIATRAAPLLSALALGMLFNGFMWMPYQLQLAHGHTRTALVVNGGALVVFLPVLVVATAAGGALGAAWVWCGLNVAYLALGVQLMYRRMLAAERLSWYVNDLLLPGTCAFVMTLLSHRLMPAELPALEQVLWIAGTVALSGTAAAGMASTLRPVLIRGLGRIAGRAPA